MERGKTRLEWQEEMSVEVLSLIRSELYLDLRFMDVALSALVWKADETIRTFGTDGEFLFYSPEQLLRVFPENPRFLDRAYLHSIFHCLFSHLWLRGDREPRMWNLACDIMVEYTIDQLEKECTKRVLSWIRTEVYNRLKQCDEGVSAAVIYRQMQEWYEYDFVALEQEFYTDTHKYWPKEEQVTVAPMPSQKRWDQLSRQTQMQMEQRGSQEGSSGQLLETQIRAQRSRRGYREFLRKFSVLREQLQTDPEEFDLNYYSYGLRLYGNMPLIEPLETKEVLKIRDFVVVVDTSYSTNGDLVKAFLQETFSLLQETDHFFTKTRIHIIQCDDQIQKDEVITSGNDLEELLQRFIVVGGGGTDFRPAFSYVNQLIREGDLQDLRGLLYFTDGKGIYPRKRPDYQTAFLFIGDYEEEKVPPWAMRLRLEPEEFLKEGGETALAGFKVEK